MKKINILLLLLLLVLVSGCSDRNNVFVVGSIDDNIYDYYLVANDTHSVGTGWTDIYYNDSDRVGYMQEIFLGD